MITTSLIVSCLIFLLIAIRQWLPPSVRIWHIMVAGAGLLLLLGEISPAKAWAAIDWNVIAYLFGVFAIGSALYDAGVSHLIGRCIAAMTSQNAALAVVIVLLRYGLMLTQMRASGVIASLGISAAWGYAAIPAGAALIGVFLLEKVARDLTGRRA